MGLGETGVLVVTGLNRLLDFSSCPTRGCVLQTSFDASLIRDNRLVRADDEEEEWSCINCEVSSQRS
jgi:hypothetical protein